MTGVYRLRQFPLAPHPAAGGSESSPQPAESTSSANGETGSEGTVSGRAGGGVSDSEGEGDAFASERLVGGHRLQPSLAGEGGSCLAGEGGHSGHGRLEKEVRKHDEGIVERELDSSQGGEEVVRIGGGEGGGAGRSRGAESSRCCNAKAQWGRAEG
jgi:hypothetical protein